MENRIQIIGTYPYMIDTHMGIPKTPENTKGMDDKLYQQWVASNKPEYTPALNQLKDKIIHISYDLFQKELKTTVNKFIQGKDKDFHYVSLVQPGKSQKWVTEIAIQLGLNASAYVCLGEEGANGLKFALEGIDSKDDRFKQHYVIVDDGSFSGTQMCNNISSANTILKTKFTTEPIFHILIPYMTKTAIDKINNLKGVKVHLYTSVKMPLVSEAIKGKHHDNILKILWPTLTKKEQIEHASSRSLYWFDHKVPNPMSFPVVLAEGTVTQPKDGNQEKNIHFIPLVHPPYKGKENEAL